MNDHHLDPPDYPEPPEWYMTLEDILLQMDPPETVANALRKAMEDWEQEYNKEQDIDPTWEDTEEIELTNVCITCGKPTECMFCSPECTPECPHGKDYGLCDACDHAADLAFDAARESRFFR